MKTIFTKLLVVTALLTSQFVFAQAPLLPLFENNTIKWGSFNWQKTADGRGAYEYTHRYELKGDTSIDSKLFKVLLSNNKICNRFSTNEPTCFYYKGKKFLLQKENLIIEVDQNGKLKDTVLYMQSTIVNSKVRFNRSNYSIVSIDSIDFNSTKIRRFNFENSFGYLDGIGFDNNGPFAVYVTYEIFEGSAYLNCFEKNGLSYSMARINQGKISNINISTASCENPLAIDAENIEEADLLKIFVNPNNQLETSEMASSIEIVDSKGQIMIQNKDASKTDVSVLPNGIYIANITFANKVLMHKFLVNN